MAKSKVPRGIKPSNVRYWAFCAGILGLLLAWVQPQAWSREGILINSIELASQAIGWAALGALAAYIRNRLINR